MPFYLLFNMLNVNRRILRSQIKRLKKHVEINFGQPQIELLNLLSTFYKSYRYDRFSLSSVYVSKKERRAVISWISKHLKIEFPEESPIFGTLNEDRYRKFVRRTTLSISKALYNIIEEKAHSINLYTYELRHGSKAESVFLREIDISDEDVLWKELLVFFMNTESSSGYLDFLREIPPLEFDPALTGDYLDCFQSNAAKALVMDELEHLYSELEEPIGERIELMRVVGAPNVDFDFDDEEWEESEEE